MKNYLALGDSYSIGERVLLSLSFPYQAVQLLRKQHIDISAAEIIAKTGWTTTDLIQAIDETLLQKKYDFVSLLIGVNNQYDGKNMEDYKTEFADLLQRSIALAGQHSSHVFVLSIPDWALTPFAEGRNKGKISGEINNYNFICKDLTEKYGCTFLDISPGYTSDAADSDFIAADGLHPSGKEYEKWAGMLAAAMFKCL